jgi:hypothetical protein
MPSPLFKLQTLTLPLMLLPAKYCPSALIAMAHISPGLFWSAACVSARVLPQSQYELAMKAQGVPTNNLSVFTPHAILALTPYLDFAFEASTRSSPRLVFSCCDQVVDAEWVCLV